MTPADPIFIDTNVLVFATVPSSPFHRPAIGALHRISQSGAATWISRQILREYLVQLTRPGVLPAPLSGAMAAAQVAALGRIYYVADETAQVTAALLNLIGSGVVFGKQVHDANVVATCMAYGIPRLLTHNIADFQRFSSFVRIEAL